MVQAWYMDSSDEDQRLPHQLDPPQPVSLADLEQLGIVYYNIEIDSEGEYKKESSQLQQIKTERGYSYEDTITVSPDKLPGYEEKIKSFFSEHLHKDEEIRLILDGCGYFDVRDMENRWIRIKLVKNDLIVLPAGIYHRFTTDEDNYIKANRLFVGEPVWTPYNRSAETDTFTERISFVQSVFPNFLDSVLHKSGYIVRGACVLPLYESEIMFSEMILGVLASTNN